MDLKKSLIIECVASTPAKDIAGETLDIGGADITPLLEGRGYANSDHQNDFTHTVGKVLDAKKIMKAEDADTPKQQEYWNQIQKPFIWSKFELFDGVGHPEADAIASVYRHYMKKGEKPPVKISVEGKTLERGANGNLKKTLIRGLALTLHPCNRETRSEVVQIAKSLGFDQSLIKSEDYIVPAFIEVQEPSLEKVYQLACTARELLRTATGSHAEPKVILKSEILLERVKQMIADYKLGLNGGIE